jgi:transposase
LVRGLPDPSVGPIKVLGVDEFALRRRHHYGTVLVDLTAGHRPVDVLIGRDAGDFADWLRAHPGVEVICRDRAGAFAEGGRLGAPNATQVADRWHLWDNLSQHIERLVAAHHVCLAEPIASPESRVDQVVPGWPASVRVEHTRQRYDQIHELRGRGLSMRVIARKLDLNFKTVRRYLRADNVEALLAGGLRSSVLDPLKPYLHERLADGQRSATVLYAALVERGYTGGYNTLRRYLRPLRGASEAAALAGLSPLPGRPAVRSVAGWITGLPGRLDPAGAEQLRAIRGRCPELDAAVRHVAAFGRMIRNLSGDKETLTGWMSAVDEDLPMLRSFTGGLRRDLDAVVAGLTMEHSSGAVEGTVNRLKQIKAAMYGRAKPDLLRKLILLA